MVLCDRAYTTVSCARHPPHAPSKIFNKKRFLPKAGKRKLAFYVEKEIRRLLVEGGSERWSPETELLLFTAARRDHLERLIRPALDRDAWVITDRFADSTRVYQGAVRATQSQLVEELHRLMIGIEPDLTFVIDIAPEISLRRGQARGGSEDRFEGMGLEFQQRLRDGFHALAERAPGRIRMIDGSGSQDEVAARVLAALP